MYTDWINKQSESLEKMNSKAERVDRVIPGFLCFKNKGETVKYLERITRLEKLSF